MSSEYKIIKLISGDTIIAEVNHKDWATNKYIKVSNAMEIMNFDQSPGPSAPLLTTTIFLARWNPYTDDDFIIVPLDKIISISDPSIPFVTFFINTIEGFNEKGFASATATTEEEEDDEEDGSNAEVENPMEALKDVFNEMMKKTKRTLH